MAVNIASYGYINSGSTIAVGIDLGRDWGAQFLQGKPEYPGNALVTTDNVIQLRSDGAIIYGFHIRCIGPGTFFTLCGGGLT
jgi:hypothetical protein